MRARPNDWSKSHTCTSSTNGTPSPHVQPVVLKRVKGTNESHTSDTINTTHAYTRGNVTPSREAEGKFSKRSPLPLFDATEIEPAGDPPSWHRDIGGRAPKFAYDRANKYNVSNGKTVCRTRARARLPKKPSVGLASWSVGGRRSYTFAPASF